MTHENRRIIEALIKTQIPKDAILYEYTGGHPQQMQIVLNKIGERSEKIVHLYKVKGSNIPEVFCLDGLDDRVIVYNERYFSFSLLLRQLYFPIARKNDLSDFAKRTFLYLISQLSLKYGDPDFAVFAFMKSVIGEKIFAYCGVDYTLDKALLETSPIDEMYMAIWLFGILHEVGHYTEDYFSYTQNDEQLIEHVANFADLLGFSPDMKEEAVRRSVATDSRSIIALNSLRSEGRADTFAFVFLFYELLEILGKEFNLIKFIREVHIFYNILSNISTCKYIASNVCNNSYEEAGIEMKLVPIANAMRYKIVFPYLSRICSGYIHGSDNAETKLSETVIMLNNIMGMLSGYFTEISAGLDDAFTFSVSRPDEKEKEDLFDKFKSYWRSVNLSEANASENLSKPDPSKFLKVVLFESLAKSLAPGSKNVERFSDIISITRNSSE